MHHRADQLHAEVAQLHVERDALKERNVDLQKRVNAQAELDRRAELELLRHADQTQSMLLRTPDIEEAMRDWYDAGQPRVDSWGEFYRERRRHLDGGY